MTTIASQPTGERVFGSYGYPTRDGRPMGETDVHRNVMFETIETLKAYYAGQQVYVTGNLLLCYREGDRRRHVSPDTMVVKGAPPGERLNYLLWEEGRSPCVVMEVTSPSTRHEDLKTKFEIYRTEIGVREYFLFDPKDEYLKPRLQGYRLDEGQYVPIEMVDGRLPSKELALHLEAAGTRLRLHNPATGKWLPNHHELFRQAEQERQQAVEERQQAVEENEHLRRELDQLRQRMEGGKQ